MEIVLGFLQKFPIRLFRSLASLIATSIFTSDISGSAYPLKTIA